MKQLAIVALIVFSACAPTNRDQAAAPDETQQTQPAANGTTAAPPTNSTVATQETQMKSYENKVAELHTTAGEIHIRFFPDVAPNHVKNFIDLAQKGFYNGSKFHRVIPGFMIQGGDPNSVSGDPGSWGTGGSGTHLQAEFNAVLHKRGIVSMARANDPNSASSQFFIMVADAPFLDNKYTAFGQVTKGMDAADKIVNSPRDPSNDRPRTAVAIERIVVRDAADDERGPAPK